MGIDAAGGTFGTYIKGGSPVGTWDRAEAFSNIWPQAGQQKRYQASTRWAPLGNISFDIAPYVPFSFEWNLREEVFKGGSAFVPHSTEEPNYMAKVERMAQNSQSFDPSTGLPGTDYWQILDDTYPDKDAEEYKEAISHGLGHEISRGTDIFDAKIEVPGEISSEMLAIDPEILDLLKDSPASKMFEDDYWDHLNDINFSSKAIDDILGQGKEYLDTSPLTPIGRSVLKHKLSALELAGIPKTALDDIYGGEETLDVSSKLISTTLKRISKEHFSVGGDMQGAVIETAEEIEGMINGFLKSADRRKWMEDAYPKWYKKLVPTALGFSWLDNKFSNWISSLGPIGRVYYGTSGKKEATKPTTKFKAAGEIRQMLKRAIQGEMMKNLVEYGLPGKGAIGSSWYYHVPGPAGTAAIFIMKTNIPGSPLTSIDAMIPVDMTFDVTGYVVPAQMEAELAGSMDAILFAAGVQAGAWDAEYLAQYIARRNAHMGAFTLMNILSDAQWNTVNNDTVSSVFNDMISQPLIAIRGMGTPKSALTTKIFMDLVKKQLKNYGNSTPVIQTIKTNLKDAFTATNDITRTWKKGFVQSIGAQSTNVDQFFYEMGGKYGVWSNQDEAITQMMGRGIASAPMFGFEDATLQQNRAMLAEIHDLKKQWGEATARGSMLRGILESVEGQPTPGPLYSQLEREL